MTLKEDIITATIEDYLEQILILSEEKGFAKVTEIAKALEITKASVNEMINKLKSIDLVHYEKYGTISLTEEGLKIAKKVKDRHDLLQTFLLLIGVDEENASNDCCLMEHNLSKITNEKLTQFIKFLKDDEQKDIIRRFKEYLAEK